MIAIVLFKTIDGKRADDIAVFLDHKNAKDYAEKDARHLYGGFVDMLTWTRSADYPKAWEALIGITGIKYVTQTWDMQDG